MKKTLLLGSLLLCSPAFTAQAADDNLMQDVFLLDPVTVTGQLEEEKLDRTTAIVVERNRSNNVADYLVRDPEISFKRKAAFGDSSDIISIRGMESKRIMLNLDGRNIAPRACPAAIISTSAPFRWTISNALRSSKAAAP